ncbi:MAG: isoleucine--tRNA ligase, partial [Dehalococcoidales bacterium]
RKPGFLNKLEVAYDNHVADFARWLIDTAGDKPVYLLAWTTTPWTLPGNTALAIAEDAEYSLIDYNGEFLILATARLEPLGLGEIPVVTKIRGASLIALRYRPLYNPNDFDVPVESMSLPDKEGKPSAVSCKEDGVINYPVIGTDFVSMDEGTGIVHVAPAYGEVDYQAGQENSLDFVHPVTLDGKIGGNYSFAGKFVKDADPLIMEELNNRGLLFRSESILHTYPFCWRCESPLLYYAKQTWYVRTTAVKEQLIEGNQQINWYPEHIKYGRFGDWLQNNIDWAFSRERYWGTPLPVWCCKSCGSCECIGGIEDLKEKPAVIGVSESLDLHRPFVDEITFSCDQCGGQMERRPEVIDCWFDSGAMPIAQWHYPFENETLLQDGRFPADYICEAVDQTRGWFYSLHAIATLLFGKPSFRNVICLGHILDEKGEKMSKARGNVVEPMSIVDKYGADALRWYCLTTSPPGNVRRFSEKLVSEINRRFLLTLWNVYSFFVTYANIDHFDPRYEVWADPPALDRWILSELNQLVLDVEKSLEIYNPTDAGRKIEIFVDGLSNWYVRRSRRRFWKSENDTDKLSAYQTLYLCLVTISKILAPFTPFLAEELYHNLVSTFFPESPASVHLNDFPTANVKLIDKRLSEDIRLAMKLSSMGRAARNKAGIKVRQPLDVNYVSLESNSDKESLQRIGASVMEELNIKGLQIIDDISRLDETHITITEGELSIAVPTTISDELINEGLAREIVHRIQTIRRSAGFDIADHIITFFEGADDIRRVMSDFTGYIRQETLSNTIIEGIPSDVAITESYRIGTHQITIGVKRST